MNLKKLAQINNLSLEQVKVFRESLGVNFKANIDNTDPVGEKFHKSKNHYPYFGFIEVEVLGNTFLMFSNSDDLVAMIFYWFGPSMYEPMSMKVWVDRCKSAQTIYDVGAFSGVYSLSAAVQNPNSNIYAFEAVRRTHARLLMNIQANRLSKRITAINRAVIDKQDLVTFYQYRGENILGNAASMIDKGIPIFSNDEKVHTISLDDFVAQGHPVPELLKIDVEGVEELVLNGMHSILAENKPQMLIEVSPQTAQSVEITLRKHGYKIYVVDETAMSLIPFDKVRSKAGTADLDWHWGPPVSNSKIMNLLAE